MAKSQPKEEEKEEEEESMCIGSIDPRRTKRGSRGDWWARCPVLKLGQQAAHSRVHVEEPNNKQRSGESSASPSSPPVISRGGSRRVR